MCWHLSGRAIDASTCAPRTRCVGPRRSAAHARPRTRPTRTTPLWAMPTMRRAVLCGGRSWGAAAPRARPGHRPSCCGAPPSGELKKLLVLELRSTQITDAALNSGTLPALEEVMLEGTRGRASAAAVDAAHDAVGEWRVVRMVCRQTRLVVRIGPGGLASAYSVSITLSVWPNCSVCQRCVPVCGQLLQRLERARTRGS